MMLKITKENGIHYVYYLIFDNDIRIMYFLSVLKASKAISSDRSMQVCEHTMMCTVTIVSNDSPL